ncbi:phage tail protein [Anaeromyxobacter sp. PSR-1]|uniref:phage tail protein n=1 Tax=Anaeromyxobacter sp. PSR-1 TaxID=1300915 RepID=UPI001ED9B172|nr:phage tail protein [Anaeromyxobacter sp. PSR-1]
MYGNARVTARAIHSSGRTAAYLSASGQVPTLYSGNYKGQTLAMVWAICEAPVAGIINAYRDGDLLQLFHLVGEGGWYEVISGSTAPTCSFVTYGSGPGPTFAGTAQFRSNMFGTPEGKIPRIEFGVIGTLSHPADVLVDLVVSGSSIPASAVQTGSYRAYCDAMGFTHVDRAINESTSVDKLIDELMRDTDSTIVWSNGGLKVIPNGTFATGSYTPPTKSLTIDQNELIVTEGEDPVTVIRIPEDEVFNEFPISIENNDANGSAGTYSLPDAGHQATYGQRRAPTTTSSWIKNPKQVMTLSGLMAQRSITRRNKYRFRVGPRWDALEPGDLVGLTEPMFGLSDQTVRIRSIEEEDDGILSIEAIEWPHVASVDVTPQTHDGYDDGLIRLYAPLVVENVSVTASAASASAAVAQTSATLAYNTANSAFTTASWAMNSASIAQASATLAFQSASAAQTSASRAFTSASAAQSAASASQATASLAFTSASNAQLSASRAQTTASWAFTSASAAQTAASAAQATASLAFSSASAAQAAASASQASASLAIQNAFTAQASASDAFAQADAAFASSSWTKDYVQSRGMNLIANGTSLLGTNYNFSGFTFTGAQANGGVGSFYTDTLSTEKRNDEVLPVEPSKTYELRFSAMVETAATASRAFAGGVFFDIDKLQCYAWTCGHFPASNTTLAAPLKPGDTTVTLTDGSGWTNDASQYNRGLIIWGYKNSFGYKYPDFTYSRYAWTFGAGALYGTTGVNGNVITLSYPIPASMGNPDTPDGAWPIGTPVSQGRAGNTSGYKYFAASNVTVPSVWTAYRGTVGGTDLSGNSVSNMFPPGSAYMKLLFLLNRDTAGVASRTYLANIWLSELAASNLADGTLSATKIVSASITQDRISANAIGAQQIIANAVTAGKINADAITSREIVAGSISGSRIVAATIQGTHLSASTIQGSHIKAQTISGSHIAFSTLVGDHIQAGTISGSEIAANTITGQNIAANTITANNISGSTITGDRIKANTISGSNIAFGTLTGDNIKAGTISGSEIAANTISGTNIAANTITGQNISGSTIQGTHIQAQTISGTHLAFGTLTGEHIQAGTIQAQHLLIAPKSLNLDPSFETGLTGWAGFLRRLPSSNAAVPVGCPKPYASEFSARDNISTMVFPVQPGETYKASGWVNRAGTGGTARLGIVGYAVGADGQDVSGWVWPGQNGIGEAATYAAGWQYVTGTYTVPANIAGLRFGPWADRVAYVGQSWYTDFNIERVADATLIVSGAIKAQHIAAQTIQGTHLQAQTISGTHVAVGTLTGDHIRAGSISGTEIAAGTITASHLAADTIKTSNYQEAYGVIYPAGTNGYYAVSGSKMFIGSTTPMRIAPGGAYIGKWLLDEVAVRSVNAIDFDTTKGASFYRGESRGSPVLYDATNGDRLAIYQRGGLWDGGVLHNQATWDFVLWPRSSSDGFDGLRYLEVTVYNSAPNNMGTVFIPIPDRKYQTASFVSVENATKVTYTYHKHTDSNQYVYSAAPNNWNGYLRVKLHNVYGYSPTRDFQSTNTAGGLMTAGAYSLGGSTGSGGGGDSSSDPIGCPVPETPVQLWDKTWKLAGDVQVGDLLWSFSEERGCYDYFPVVYVSRGELDLYRLTTEDGRSLRVSVGHQFMTPSGWALVQDMRPGDEILGQPGGVVASVEPDGRGETCRITVRDAHTYLTDGLLSHNATKL